MAPCKVDRSTMKMFCMNISDIDQNITTIIKKQYTNIVRLFL